MENVQLPYLEPNDNWNVHFSEQHKPVSLSVTSYSKSIYVSAVHKDSLISRNESSVIENVIIQLYFITSVFYKLPEREF
jgi:hypothetical protein